MAWLRGAMAGLVGGLLAAGAMSLAHRAIGAVAKAEAPPAGPKEEDATVKVASALASRLGHPLTEDEKSWAGTLVHYAFGAGVGAVYGAVAEVAPFVTRGVGLPFGAAVWLGAHVVTVPALKLARPPTQQPLGQEAQEFGLHLLYGLTTELIRRLIRRVLA